MQLFARTLLLAVLALAGVSSATEIPVKTSAFPQETARMFHTQDGLPSEDILSIVLVPEGPVAATEAGTARFTGTAWEPLGRLCGSKYVLVVSTGMRILLLKAMKPAGMG